MRHMLLSLIKSWRRDKGTLSINIIGLAIGLCASILLMVYVINEWSYDKHFAKKDRIVQLNSVWIENGTKEILPICSRKAYTDLPEKVAGIEKAVQIYKGWTAEAVYDHKHFQDLALLYSDPEFFDIFDLAFVSGDPKKALAAPYSVILTKTKADAIFGSVDPIGQSITIDEAGYTVTGVVEKLPANTHFNFDVLASISSIPHMKVMTGLEFFTYYLIGENSPAGQVAQSIRNEYKAMLEQSFSGFNSTFEAITTPLTQIHLFAKADYGLSPNGSFKSLLMLLGLSMFILLLAIMNFINLIVAQSQNRAKEIGIRKANGAGAREISKQFFGETSVTVSIAFLIGTVLAMVLLGPFTNLIGKPLEQSIFRTPFVWTSLGVLIVMTILASGSYPALYLSRFRPLDTLKKDLPGTPKKRFANIVVIFQSVVTIVLICGFLIVHKQTRYLENLPAGYNPKQVLIITHLNNEVSTQYPVIKEELMKIPGIKMVGASQHLVGDMCSGQGIRRWGQGKSEQKSIEEYRIMPHLCELLQLELKEGRFFTANDPRNKDCVVLNETAAKMLNIPDPVVGNQVAMFEQPMEIIGVVRDFYYDTPANKIKPLVLTNYRNYPQNIYVRFDDNVGKQKATRLIAPVFKQIDRDFIPNTRWAEDYYQAKFDTERTLLRIVLTGTLLSLLVAMLGLFAVHSFTISRRIKEIGIRKVSGSSTWSVVVLLSGNVCKRITVSALFALPIAWLLGKYWLDAYSNRVAIGILVLLVPVVIHALIALLATFFVSWKAAMRNPVEALRYE
ncbi:MAG: ABC transporter permease [Breznakibacter sp.]